MQILRVVPMVMVVLVVTTSCLAAPNLGINAVEQSIMLVQSSRFSLLLLVARSRCQQSSAQYVKLSIHDEPLAMSIESQPFLLLCCGFNRGSYSCYLNPTPYTSQQLSAAHNRFQRPCDPGGARSRQATRIASSWPEMGGPHWCQ